MTDRAPHSANAKRVIPIADARRGRPLPAPVAAGDRTLDPRGRMLHDLRISVTDRCNFRCTYCMPKEVFDSNYQFMPQGQLLTFEEITRVAGIFKGLGVRKLRITGGEPLLRRHIERLIEMLGSLGDMDLTLTTNGSLLARKAPALAAAGLKRVTVSLDALDDKVFRAMNDVDFPVADVLAGIDAAARAGLDPIKVNMVVKRGVNDQDIVAMARHFKGTGHILRFIEFMDVGATNGWRMNDVVPSAEVVRMISEFSPLEAIDPNYEGEVAERWRYVDGSGEIGVISSVTQAFCSTCTRARLSTEGKLYTCLFATSGYDLRTLLRNGVPDAEIAGHVAAIWTTRDDRYSEIRTADTSRARDKVEMSYIGG
ncbi:MAG: GTP 3',8-cyclase MoaA [Burkholderiales bacterium]